MRPGGSASNLILRALNKGIGIGGWGGESFVTPNREIVSFRSCVRACERARRGEAKLCASERRFDPVARAKRGQESADPVPSHVTAMPGSCPVRPFLINLHKDSS